MAVNPRPSPSPQQRLPLLEKSPMGNPDFRKSREKGLRCANANIPGGGGPGPGGFALLLAAGAVVFKSMSLPMGERKKRKKRKKR